MVGFPLFRSASGVPSLSCAATIIQMSRPSSDFPSESIFNCGAAATSLRNQATVSSYDGVARKSLFSAGVIQGSLLGTTSARLFPSQGTSGGRIGLRAASENPRGFVAGVSDASMTVMEFAAAKNRTIANEQVFIFLLKPMLKL